MNNEAGLEEAIKAVETMAEDQETVLEETTLSPIEKEAMEMGWKPKEQFLEEGGNEEVWSSAREYVKYGKLQQANKDLHDKIDRIGKGFDRRVEELNKLHKAQMDAKLSELRNQQRTAVENADTEAYDHAQKQIDDLQKDVKSSDPLIAEWESNNPWIYDPNNPKTFAANGIFSSFMATNPGATTEQALEHLDKKMAETFPDVNPRRETAPTTEASAPTRKKRGLTMSDLTPDERDLWRNAGTALFNNDEKVFLKACEDARKGA